MTDTKVSYRVVAPGGLPGPWNDVPSATTDAHTLTQLTVLTQRADLLWYGGTVEKRVVTYSESEDITTVHKPEPTIVAVVESLSPGTYFTKGPYHTEDEARRTLDPNYGDRPYVLKRLAPL